ncbi:hypothetical protein P3T37_003558 [Kitasatospora sp. MAA4]|nr:hypothetical protein [Kitasatospora sp. MAA4]
MEYFNTEVTDIESLSDEALADIVGGAVINRGCVS